ncbi:hypothetical protein M0R72_04015 [Candidatus Pacearchaeota archaeon]|jgi:energy-coupling factor transporter transmembrane protein EcfT|nr:hypothetical protein [Candidatus Pacearchaeota archaeon]
MINYIDQLIDNFLISIWTGIITGIVVYLKIEKANFWKIIESISLGFWIFIILLYLLHPDLLNLIEWGLGLFFFLVVWISTKIINLKK